VNLAIIKASEPDLAGNFQLEACYILPRQSEQKQANLDKSFQIEPAGIGEAVWIGSLARSPRVERFIAFRGVYWK
jgi:hypothetical protein